MSYDIVWFKRDLRLVDHLPLIKAAERGMVRCIYIIEPMLWKQPDVSLQHFEFIRESLIELDTALRTQGGSLEIHYGDTQDVFGKILLENPFLQIHSHQEIGNQFTYQRDQKLTKWCKDHHIIWNEYPQFGVVRGLKNRDLWQAAWEKHMAYPIQPSKTLRFWHSSIQPLLISPPAHLRHNPPLRQRGGRTLGLASLEHFLNAKSIGYRGGISSPLSAPDACSRISVYLSYGCISMREVVQKTRMKLLELPPHAERHRAGLKAFISRLYWHCHFIQKLESEPAIEWHNMHRGYDGLREDEFNPMYFEALKSAQTGWPMVDACVMMLHETGWLNFRMRAMLVSVAAYPLWLHWQPVGEWLATQFLDYEPGIHWSQMQMQSGTTGINTTRVYNPIKQAKDHDPQGYFVKKWLPHLQQVPNTWLFEPWRMNAEMREQFGLRDLSRRLEPIVHLEQAIRLAKERLHQRRQLPEVKAEKQKVITKHASRVNPIRRSSPSKTTKQKQSNLLAKQQLGFDF